MKKTQPIIGAFLTLASIILGALLLKSEILFFRLLVGMGLGYALTRSFMGFAGSVNRAYRGGSTQLMQVLMFMFVVTAVINAGFLLTNKPTDYDLWINPINLGLVIGGLLFGFGMTFSSCCASGVLTDLVTDLPRALITLVFFCFGVYMGFPLQSSQSWITDTVVSSSSYGGQGVFLPDLFVFDGLHGYLGALLLTAFFAVITVLISKKYEDRRRTCGTYSGIETEILQKKARMSSTDENSFNLMSRETYHKLFVSPWSMNAGAIMIVVLFTLMLAVTKGGWGASTPFGIWFGQALAGIGIPVEQLAALADRPVALFSRPFFEHPISVQNFGIFLGTLICIMLMGQLSVSFNYNKKQLGLFALGGLLMGLGTRFANGCNVGALYTPIANLSLSGWIFFLFLVAGGILGNLASTRLGLIAANHQKASSSKVCPRPARAI